MDNSRAWAGWWHQGVTVVVKNTVTERFGIHPRRKQTGSVKEMVKVPNPDHFFSL